jgi:Phosphotransferase enzyme family
MRSWPVNAVARRGSRLGYCGMGEGEPLSGGSDTEGIVRIGETVRRPLRPFSLTVQAYLARLRDVGFTGAPLPLGVDEQGREVLSFVPGEVHHHPVPPEAAGEDVLVALARLIRALHEASAGWVPPPGAVWGGSPANAGRVTERAGLVSHRDYATGNVIFRDGLPAALIDFGLARPATRVYDIANALWFWAPLKWGDPRDRPPALAGADIPHRVAVFADAYGMTAQQRADLAPLAVDIAHRYHEDSRASAGLSPVWHQAWEGNKHTLSRAEAWVREMAPAIAARLSQPG